MISPHPAYFSSGAGGVSHVSQLHFRAYRTGDMEAIAASSDFLEELGVGRQVGYRPGLSWTIARGIGASAGPIAASSVWHEGEDRYALSAWCAVLTKREWAFAGRCARQVLQFLAAERGARAVYAAARSNRPGAIGYLTRLGFEWAGDENQGDVELSVFCWRP